MNPLILSRDERVFYFPVRHHSPAAARLIEKYIRDTRPAAVLIEGPADFNSQMAQLALPHTLPIAIYSYAMLQGDCRIGVFYPFCDYSPEWRAIQAAKDISAPVAFIDKPWSEIGLPTARKNRYSDAPLLRSDYISALCRKFAVHDFHDLWDLLFEIDGELCLDEYLKRCHHLCYHMRLADGAECEDVEREEFMAAEIRRAADALAGQIVVITGGFHSYALFARFHDLNSELPHLDRQPVSACHNDYDFASERQALPEMVEGRDPNDQGDPSDQNDSNGQNDLNDPNDASDSGNQAEFEDAILPLSQNFSSQGISLTPYSYERLDSLTGYEAGMPGPGFYHEVYVDQLEGSENTYRKLLFKAVQALRQKKQLISSADVIAVEGTAAGLAALRGHKRVWRRDLLDGIIGALVKDEVTVGLYHPLQEAVDKIMRGDRIGRLAEGTNLPLLVSDIAGILKSYSLEPSADNSTRALSLDLDKDEDRLASCMLHRLACLEIPGFELSSDSLDRVDDDTGSSSEIWSICKHPLFESACIESSIYGCTLADASVFKLVEKSAAVESDSFKAAQLLLSSCLMGFSNLSGEFCHRLRACIDQDSDLVRLSLSLKCLLFLYRYDHVLKEKPVANLGELLQECFARCVWLLDSTGTANHQIGSVLRAMLEAFERCQSRLNLNRPYFIDVLQRVRADADKDAILRGAATGALWTLDEAPAEAIIDDMTLFNKPEQIGDFLTGVFLLAREAAKHREDLLLKIDQLLMGFSTEEYLEALPHLRLAFAVFTPREKHHMARSILRQTDSSETEPGSDISIEVAPLSMLVEARLKETLKRYGLRGFGHE